MPRAVQEVDTVRQSRHLMNPHVNASCQKKYECRYSDRYMQTGERPCVCGASAFGIGGLWRDDQAWHPLGILHGAEESCNVKGRLKQLQRELGDAVPCFVKHFQHHAII